MVGRIQGLGGRQWVNVGSDSATVPGAARQLLLFQAEINHKYEMQDILRTYLAHISRSWANPHSSLRRKSASHVGFDNVESSGSRVNREAFIKSPPVDLVIMLLSCGGKHGERVMSPSI